MGKAAEQIVEQHGRIDVLVNNAGIGAPLPEVDVLMGGSADATMSDQVWDTQLAANLRTAFASASAVVPKMEDGGNIINIASIAALEPTPSLVAYGAAKAAVVHLTRTQAIQYAPRRIRVNCICPGLLWTRAWEMMTATLKQNNPDFADLSQREIFDRIVARSTPLGSEQTPEDIGNLAVFYSSDKARMITGAIVAVDGGNSL
jgi:meso-butanediol dehydrogenase/(S,S)-butanediol dehydrogenase/diacetyl reductase